MTNGAMAQWANGDDIVVFSRTLKEHLHHLRLHFNALLDANSALLPIQCDLKMVDIAKSYDKVEVVAGREGISWMVSTLAESTQVRVRVYSKMGGKNWPFQGPNQHITGRKTGPDQLGAEPRLAHVALPRTHVRFVMVQLKTMYAQVQKQKWTLVASFPRIVYSASIWKGKGRRCFARDRRSCRPWCSYIARTSLCCSLPSAGYRILVPPAASFRETILCHKLNIQETTTELASISQKIKGGGVFLRITWPLVESPRKLHA
jgi:hypothetical protein